MLLNHCSSCLKRLLPSKLRQFGDTVVIPSVCFWTPARGDEYAELKSKNKRKYKEIFKKGLQGAKEFPGEFSKLGTEFKEKFTATPKLIGKHDECEILYKFEDKETVDSWALSTDKDMNIGKSHAEFVLGQNKTGIFRGFLNTETVKDGIVKNAGYCNIRSPTKEISFKRTVPHDLSIYNHLALRVRGDGRPYQIMLSMDRYFDVQWNDQYSYTLFTRGGPYWQYSKIPFSKFFLSSKGRIQDCQGPVELDKIRTFGLTASDGYTGPFQLEIDFIGAVMDCGHVEEFAYEMYETGGSCLY